MKEYYILANIIGFGIVGALIFQQDQALGMIIGSIIGGFIALYLNKEHKK